MKQYKVFKHPTGVMEAVKQGWSWPGFLFGPLWALAKKMWLLGGLYLAAAFLLAFVVELAGAGPDAGMFFNLIGMIAGLIFGAGGNQWREKNLTSRGYDLVGEVESTNPDGAIATFVAQVAAPSETPTVVA